MYTRAYPEKPSELPDGYVGTAMSGDGAERDYIDNTKNPWEKEAKEAKDDLPVSKGVSPLTDLFGGLFKNGRFSLQSIGVEEVLIIAAAAYMLLSRDGDKECGIMLLVLLFIS